MDVMAERLFADAGVSPEHFSSIVYSSPDPIIAGTLNGVITIWNPAAERLYGYTAAEAIGQSIAMLTPPGLEDELAMFMHTIQQGQAVEGYETVRRTRDGRHINVSLTMFPLRDTSGQLIGASVTVRDITGRLRDAAALAASERRFRAAFDDAPIGMALVGLDGQILQANRAICRQLGYSDQELVGRNFSRVLGLDRDHHDAGGRLEPFDVLGSESFREVTVRHRTGGLRRLDIQTTVVRDDMGQPAYLIAQSQDLTAQVSSQQMLAEARTRIDNLLDRIGGAYIEVDPDWNIEQVNAAAEDLLGLSRADLLGCSLLETAPAELLGAAVDAVQAARVGPYSAHNVDFAFAPRKVWLNLRAYASASGASLLIRDITLQHGLEEELRSVELRFQALVEQLPAVVYLHHDDPDKTMIYRSPYFETLIGIPFEDSSPSQFEWVWRDLVHPEDREWVLREQDEWHDVTAPIAQEYRFRRADGSYVWVNDTFQAVLDEAGKVIAWQGIMVDITAQKEASDAVARLAAIVEASDEAIYTRTLDGIITYWNPAAERLYGYTADEAVGQPLALIFPTRDAGLYKSLDEMEKAVHVRGEGRNQRKDGSIVDVAYTIFPVRDADGTISGVSGIVRDISGRKAAERALRAALDTAESAARMKGQFLDMMSHDLRTPLQAVLGYADFLLSQDGGSLTPEQREDIGYIRNGANRMVQLIEQLLDLSRMDAGRLELRSEPVDVRQIMEAVRQDIAPQAETRGLRLTVSVPSRMARALGDPDRVRQIVLNLAGNAVKFTEAGEIQIRARSRGEWVEISVQDTGIGISPDELAHVFEEFRQVGSKLSRRHGGSGLGLAISQRLANQMEGAITVESTPGEGSTFTLRLPKASRQGMQACAADVEVSAQA
jgi:PAS domain S-box-containing protein